MEGMQLATEACKGTKQILRQPTVILMLDGRLVTCMLYLKL